MQRYLVIAAVVIVALGAGMLLRHELNENRLEAVNSAEVSAERLAFTLPDLSGRPRDFAEWDGKSRIVNFWATWCAPCRREIPLLKDTQEAHGDDLQVIGIAVDFVEDVITYAQEAQFNYPVLVGQEDAMAVAEASGVPFIGLPFTLVVTRDGELLAAHMGEIHAPQIDTIVDVLEQLDAGLTDTAGARAALAEL